MQLTPASKPLKQEIAEKNEDIQNSKSDYLVGRKNVCMCVYSVYIYYMSMFMYTIYVYM